VGGETAEHPGLLGEDDFDVAGAGTGVVEADRLLGPDRIRTGDTVIAMAASGLHSNGYSLVRHVLLNQGGLSLDARIEEFGRTLGEELLEPTKIYSLDCLALTGTTEVHAFSHITGGGLAANLARVIPDGLHAIVDRSTWTPAPVFDLVGRTGQVEGLELEKTLNMGVGMIAIVPQESTDVALTTLADRGVEAWVAGEITERADHTTGAALVGTYADQ
jgi:phosphoribosylformylglycinamidine cyclo-ligase